MPPVFRASELPRLFECPGSGYLQRADDVEGVAAAWGTKVHAWMETGEYPEGEDGAAIEKRVKKAGVDRGKLWPGGEFEVALAYNLVTGEARRYIPPVPVPPGYTARTHKSAWKNAFDTEWATGTLDFAAELMDTYWVDDLKTGRNAHWKQYEPQQLFYCLALSVHRYGAIQGGRSTITHWPKYPIGRAPGRHGTALTAAYLVEFDGRLKALRNTVLAARNGVKAAEAELSTGEHCRFCPSQVYCPAQGAGK